MSLSNRNKIVVAVVVIASAYAAGYFTGPEKVTEVVKYKEAKDTVRIVTKYVYPDGTTKEQTVEKDKSIVSLDSEKEVINRNLGVRIALKTKIGESEPVYALAIDSPPLLKLFKYQVGLSASVNTEKEAFGGIYVQF